MIVFFVVLNFAISLFNAWSVGRSWAECKAQGGLARFMSWMGAIMAAAGFVWCYTAMFAGIAALTGKVPPRYINGIFELGYLVVIIPIIGSGLAIMVDSWAYFWRQRNFTSGATALWNTYAEISNVLNAASAIPDFIKDLGGLFGGKDSDSDSDGEGAMATLVILLVVVALCIGVLTTVFIIRKTAKRHVANVRDDYWDRVNAERDKKLA